MNDRHTETSDSARRLFEAFLAQQRAGQDVDIEQLLTEHPGVASEVRVLHTRWLSMTECVDDLGQGTITATVTIGSGGYAGNRGDILADFRLIEPLGHGGMGEVWLAEEQTLRRRVALKLVRGGKFDERTLTYFAREARAGGRLAHPAIVSVYGHGVEGTLGWIALELVAGGVTLRDRIVELREAEVLPVGHFRATAELVVEIADALAAAHAAGVIHRDVKPGNVLLTPSGRPKLTDFGLARISDEAALSVTGEVAGTWSYMSPEQVRGRRSEVDPRTDQFSLGVVLYELLTLRRPFAGDTSQQIALQILNVEPPDPRSIRSHVPRDLAVVCLKLLEKSREQRYHSMGDLAADLRRFLGNEPIHARPPSFARVSIQWVQRHPTVSSLTALAAVALALILNLFVRNVRANANLADERDDARRQAWVAHSVNEFLNEAVLGKANPEQRMGLAFTVLEALDDAATGIDGRFPDEPLVEAAIRVTLGLSYFGLGEYERAIPHWQAATTLRESVLPLDDEETLEALRGLALSKQYAGHADFADLTRVALERAEKALGPEHPLTLSLLNNMALVHRAQARFELAESMQRETVATFERVLGPRHAETESARTALATILYDGGHLEDCEAILSEQLERFRAQDPRGPDTLSVARRLAEVWQKTKRGAEAIELHREVLEGYSELVGDRRPETLSAMNSLAVALDSHGDHGEARELYGLLLERLPEWFSANHERILITRYNLALSYKRTGDFKDAARVCDEVLAVLRREGEMRSHFALALLMNHAAILEELQDTARAKALYTEAAQRSRADLPPGHPRTMSSLRALAQFHRKNGSFDEARASFRAASDIARECDLAPPEHFGRYLAYIGDCYADEEAWQLAVPPFLDAFADLERRFGAADDRTKAVAAKLATAYGALSDDDACARWRRKSE